LLDLKSQQDQEEILGHLLFKEKAFRALRLVDAEGNQIAFRSTTTRAPEGNQFLSEAMNFITSEPTGDENLEARVFYSEVQFTTDTHQPYMIMATPIYNRRDGTLSYVLFAHVRLEQLSETLQDLEINDNVNEGTQIYIVQNEKIIAHPDASVLLQESFFSPPSTPGLTTGHNHQDDVLMVTYDLFFGSQVFTIVTETPFSNVWNLTLSSWRIILGLVGITGSVGIFLAVYATNGLTNPIQNLVNTAQKIREGDFSQQAPPSELSELNTLATTFNQMTSQLSHTLENLEQRVAARTQALKTSSDVSHYLSTILAEDQLVAEVAGLVQSAFNYYHVNIFLLDDQTLHLVAGTGTAGRALLAENFQIPLGIGLVGQAASQKRPILVPTVRDSPDWVANPILSDTQAELAVPISRGTQVLGVLDVQHNVAGGLRQEDADLIQSIANQLAVALLNAQTFEQLVSEKFAEARQKEEAEKLLEAYRLSPVGRAEAFAQQLAPLPDLAFTMLHQLAQTAGQNPDSVAILNQLPRILEDTQPRTGQRPPAEGFFLARTAEGFNFLIASQNAAELLQVGLRILSRQISPPSTPDVTFLAQAQQIYEICQLAVEVHMISHITQFDYRLLTDNHFSPEFPLTPLTTVLAKLKNITETLSAYERVTTLQDKLGYLVSAVERLRQIERQARTQLGTADLNILIRITENWQAVMSRTLSELQTQAKINCRLLTRHSWQHDIISITLQVWNTGRGAALNLKVALLPEPEYTLVDDSDQIFQLNPGEEEQIVIRLRPRQDPALSQFRVRFAVLYDDPRGPGQTELFADVIHLLSEPRRFQHIPNPYIVGTPLEPGSALFFGREELLEAIQENLASAHRNNLVLIGQRRMGKTSILKQLRKRLGAAFVPVYLDGQVMGLDPGMANFFLGLATEIMFALEDQGIDIAPPTIHDFSVSPAASFEHQFLVQVFSAIGDRALLVLFDEFEELEIAVQRGHLDASIFGFLRHLIQHTPKLSFIFCGTHRLEELVTDYWNVLFNISLYQRIGYLSRDEATRLIQQPVEPFGMQYDDLALEKIWRVTAGHPYFLQLICHNLVNRHNRTQNNYLTVVEVNATLDEILSTGEAHFIYLWTESSLEERLILVALSRSIPLTGSVQAAQLNDYLTERGIQIERRAVRDALYRLSLRDILKEDDTESVEEPIYRWQLGLLGLWVEKFKSLGRVMDEVTK
ncbi:MAG: GAF domain-containing protein, partial [Anaerolineales bacterium]|nr:GAF domain-containing protein [Anaerolineales bacterium]